MSNSSLGGSRLLCDIEGPRCTRTSAVDLRDGVEAGVEAAEAGVAGVESKLETAMRARFQTSDTALSAESALVIDDVAIVS